MAPEPRPAAADGLPSAPGAYGLVIETRRACRVPRGRAKPWRLAPGRYFYAGSANGPGGLRARVNRHLQGTGAPHWHVDHLRAAGRVVAAWLGPGAAECALLERVRAMPGVRVPAPGLGSSDCRRCPSHLLALPPGVEAEAVLAALGPGISRTFAR